MGLLDDAIREHLDLKRRRGGDPAEIERAEREALGPVRRAPEPQEADEPEFTQSLPYDDRSSGPVHEEDELEWDDGFDEGSGALEPFDDVPVQAADAEPEEHQPPPPRAASAHEEPPTQHMPLHDDDADDEFEPPAGAAVPPPHPAAPTPAADERPAPPRQPTDHRGEETIEYEVEGEFAHEGEAKDEDVLEETPEFLQDTPDHDRLWFEQRPPKDFDFDG